MIKNVHLQNLALIKEADIDYEGGLNIMTGETGAGKSVIIGSINMALGDKANKSIIRTGTDSALVEISFSSNDKRVLKRLDELDIPYDDGNIIVTRKLTKDSSSCRINSRTVTLGDLKSVTSLLVDIHGQHDHQSLLDPSKHLDIVDEFGGEEISSAKKLFHESYTYYRLLRNRMRKFSQNPEELSKEMSFLEFEVNEIDEADLKSGEDDQLEAEYKRMANSGRINDGLKKINSELFDDQTGISARISDSIKEINHMISLEPDMAPLLDYAMDLETISRDFRQEISHRLDTNSFDGQRFQEVHQRLNLINKLKSKYGQTIDDILSYRNSLNQKIDEIRNYSEGKEKLQSEMDELKAKINHQASGLSSLRKKAAATLENFITENLKDLNFQNVDFKIDFSKADKIYENGFDKVEFMISTNIGEPRKPLVKVASGGELSRIMLAIKASIADADQTETLIFDEIDTGISGRTAQKVAEKLAFLSRTHQLICITHLPQIAAMANIHFAIEKSVSDGSTLSGIRKLNVNESVEELARLLSGSDVTPISLRSAAEMKAAAASLR